MRALGSMSCAFFVMGAVLVHEAACSKSDETGPVTTTVTHSGGSHHGGGGTGPGGGGAAQGGGGTAGSGGCQYCYDCQCSCNGVTQSVYSGNAPCNTLVGQECGTGGGGAGGGGAGGAPTYSNCTEVDSYCCV
jgi:hypothetical protein